VRRCRLAVCAVLTVAAATAGILPFTAASADPSNIIIGSVSSPNSGSGALSVVVTSPDPLTGLTVHFTSPGGNVAAPVTDFDLADADFSPSQPTTYLVETPLTSAAGATQNYLPPGKYTVTVDATDAAPDGETVTGVAPQPNAQFPFLIQQIVQLNPASIDYAEPTVTFTGQVTGVWPGTSTTLPAGSGENVQINGPVKSGPDPTGLTSGGSFSITAPAAEVGQKYTATVSATGTGTSATSSPPVVVTETADKVALSARLAKTTIKYGQTDTISGTASYTPAVRSDAVVPLPGATVTLSAPGQKHLTAVTGPKGGFTKALPAQHAGTVWTVSVGGTPLLELAAKPLRLNVQLPTQFRRVSLSLGAFRELSVESCLQVTSPGGARDVIIEPVTLQWATRARGPWKKLATILPHVNTTGYCADGTPIWLGNARVPVTNGYYRLVFAGTSGYQPAYSAAAHRWRDATRITDFKISPQSVPYKGVVTISGRLWRNTGAWHPYGGRSVVIAFEQANGWAAYVSEPKTGPGGYFSGRFVIYETAPFLAEYEGDKTDFGSTSGQIKVSVTSSGVMQGPVLMPGTRPLRRVPGQ
jgi:hypothetical protein